MKHCLRFIIALFVLCPNNILAQKVKNYLGINFGAGVYSNSMLFPYDNNITENNRTGEIQFNSANPVWSIGFSYDRVNKKGLVLKANVSYQSMSYAFSTANNRFEYFPIIQKAYITSEFNTVEYQINTFASDFLIGSNVLENRKMALSVMFGPQVLYNFNRQYNHYPGVVYINGRTDLGRHIGLAHMPQFLVGIAVSPQMIVKLNSSLKLSSSLNLSYYFNSFVKYNSFFDGMISSPFMENTFPFVSAVIKMGLLYEL